MDAIGRRAIREFMPEQHRQFFSQLPFMIVGSTDSQGQLWASILPGTPGFVQSPTPTSLTVNTPILPGDPLASAIRKNARLGLLGLEMPTRRRNRVNAKVTDTANNQFTLEVEQSFGNCPQYIQTREFQFIRSPSASYQAETPETFSNLSDSLTVFIRQADTFFVASSAGQTPSLDNSANHPPHDGQDNAADNSPVNSLDKTSGVDVSHRGGMPGFIKVQGNTLTIPDYAGNNFFNTLGNFVVNPKAGLLFVDFTTGDVFMLTGEVNILPSDSPIIKGFQGALRGWQFTLTQGLILKKALPFRASFNSYSPNSQATGTWAQTEALLAAQAQRNRWRDFTVSRVVDESSTIRSFYLQAKDGGALIPPKPGQHLTLRVPVGTNNALVIRNYTISSASGESYQGHEYYRISVKRESQGLVSSALHASMLVGQQLEIKAPSGLFHMDSQTQRPGVLIGAGVGIPPMVAMANDALNEGLRSRYIRPLSVIHGAKDIEQRAFYTELRALEQKSAGRIRYYSVLSDAAKTATSEQSYLALGRIDHALLSNMLAQDALQADSDFYLCGPQSFMQSIYDVLICLGINDKNIHAEAFGPSALQRQNALPAEAHGTPHRPQDEAMTAKLTFAQSNIEYKWHRGDATLLETAQAQGLSPAFSCRNGQCGACAVPLQSGTVSYRTPVTAPITAPEVLICCAVPAKGSQQIILDM
jgi:ferredoxin-NADP reductase/predicted pyridoxine 5'-phosphate oxidase superfamily flavin-nucleotide-binding protein